MRTARAINPVVSDYIMISYTELERLSKIGESEKLEFKPSTFPDKPGSENPVLKGIVALANTRGGTLIIGVEKQGDDYIILGHDESQDDVDKKIHNIESNEMLQRKASLICKYKLIPPNHDICKKWGEVK